MCHDRGMIKADQPKIFTSGVRVILSSVTDGNMRTGIHETDGVVYENRRTFLAREMIAMQASVLCDVTYDREDFTQYAVVKGRDKGRGMMPGTECIIADALTTDEKNIALFLPLADCAGAVFYDPARQPRLMLAHLGRHSVEQYGAEKCVKFMHDKFGSKPEDILVWIGPTPNGSEYPLWKRDNKSFRDAIHEDLTHAGITSDHIEISDIDTVTNTDYFSHSEFLKGNRDQDGRFAIAAVVR